MNNFAIILLTISLSLTGKIDIRDLITLRDNPDPQTKILDLSGADIAEYTYASPAYVGLSHFEANSVPQYIFFRAPYESIILPDNITSIENGAFSGADIVSIVIPEGVTTIGDYAFYGCPRLRSITLPASLRHIGKGAFADCPALTDIDLSRTAVTDIPQRCFAGSSALSHLLLPTGILSVGSEAFADTRVNSLRLPMVQTLAPYALAGMPHLEQVILNKDAQYSEGTLMNDRSLVNVTGMPGEVPALFAANCTTLVPSDIFASTTHIGEFAFTNTQADILILSAGLTAIDRGAFAGLTSLHTINADALLADTPAVDPDAFMGLNPADITLHVATDCEDPWRQHPVWNLFNITSGPTVGTDQITADASQDTIEISVRDHILTITATEPLTRAVIYAQDGTLQALLPTGVPTISHPIADITQSIIIVTVATPTAQKTAKILL